MKTRFFLTIIAAVFMATSVSAQDYFLEDWEPFDYIEYDGHLAAVFDADDDEEGDYMIVDADDSNDLTEEDLMVDLEDGFCLTMAEVMEILKKDEAYKNEHFIEGDDVLSYDEIEGHEAANIDSDDDGEVDMTIIDADDSNDLSDADIVIDYTYDCTYTVGELMGEDYDEED